MYNEQNFAFLQKMLGTCYPLHFWTYDAQMNLLPEQTEEDTFIDRIITANGMKEMLCQAARMEQATPVELVDEMLFERVEDYRMMIPPDLSEFTTQEYAKSAKIPLGQAQTALNIFHYLDLVERIGKKGNAYVYEVRE